ncbi:MAG TPA: ScyD/ScyE family protein [Leptolyngbyaceae cyanobacterium]
MKLTQLSLSILTCCLAIAAGTTVQAASLSIIANELDNARGLSFGSDGSIYVMEAGNGGNCPPSATLCAGNTGAVTKITADGQQRILPDLPSLAVTPSTNQRFVDGPQELKFDSSGNTYFLNAYGTFPGSRDSELNAASGNTVPPNGVSNTPSLGQFYSVDLNTGTLTSIVDIAKYELVNNPDGTDLVSNPYALAINGDTAYIADAGANTVFSVKLDGSDLQAVPLPKQTIENPELPSGLGQVPEKLEVQSVPTGVTVGSDGALYVSELTGFPYPEGKARIFRIGADHKPEVYADGFTQISDLEFDKDGNLLVLQYADRSQWKGDLAGSLIQIAPDGTRTTLVSAGEGLEGATALGISPNNEIYVTNKGDRVGLGQVIKIDRTEAVPEPTSALGILAFGALGFGILLHK